MKARREVLSILVLWAVLLTAPFWGPAFGLYTSLITRIVVLALGAVALNFLLGFTGVVSFGHAAFFGLGGYGAAFLIKYFVPSTPLAILCGAVLGTIAGVVVGGLIRKLRGIYFAVVTIAFGQIFFYIAIRWNVVTGGDDGLTGWTRVPIGYGGFKLDILHSQTAFYYFALLIFAVAIGVIALLLRSPFGRMLAAIRENEQRAKFLGLSVDRYIWVSFIISSFFMSISGALYALLNNFADPHTLHWTMSGDFVMMIILGSMRSLWGPLLGAAFFVGVQDVVSTYTDHWMIILGVMFMAIVLYMPHGLLGIFSRGTAR